MLALSVIPILPCPLLVETCSSQTRLRTLPYLYVLQANISQANCVSFVHGIVQTTAPSICGWDGLVTVGQTPSSERISLSNSDVKLVPGSVRILFGTPKLDVTSSTCSSSATFSMVTFLSGKAKGYLVKLLITTRM